VINGKSASDISQACNMIMVLHAESYLADVLIDQARWSQCHF